MLLIFNDKSLLMFDIVLLKDTEKLESVGVEVLEDKGIGIVVVDEVVGDVAKEHFGIINKGAETNDAIELIKKNKKETAF